MGRGLRGKTKEKITEWGEDACGDRGVLWEDMVKGDLFKNRQVGKSFVMPKIYKW